MLTELIGIHGSGKTYYLERLNGDGILCVDFGKELKKWLEVNNRQFSGIHPPVEYTKEFIDFLCQNEEGKQLIITSHIVHYKEGKFAYDMECEMYAKAEAHVFIYSDPVEILNRRLEDYYSKGRDRDLGTIGEIKRHQDISLKLTKELSKKLNSKLLVLNNSFGNGIENIAKIKEVLEGFK